MDNPKIELLIRHGIDNTLKQMQTRNDKFTVVPRRITLITLHPSTLKHGNARVCYWPWRVPRGRGISCPRFHRLSLSSPLFSSASPSSRTAPGGYSRKSWTGRRRPCTRKWWRLCPGWARTRPRCLIKGNQKMNIAVINAHLLQENRILTIHSRV